VLNNTEGQIGGIDMGQESEGWSIKDAPLATWSRAALTFAMTLPRQQ